MSNISLKKLFTKKLLTLDEITKEVYFIFFGEYTVT